MSSKTPVVDRDLDRDLTVALVERTGRSLATFTVRDVRQVMHENPNLQLTDPSSLSRNVRRLVDGLIVEVGQGDLLTDAAPRKKAPYRYALRTQRKAVEAGRLRLSDAEKTLAALHVAVRLWPRWVPTRAVTDVLRTVPDLIPDRDVQTSTRLGNLSRRTPPPVERRKATGARWTEWRPAGGLSVDLPVERWTAEYRQRSNGDRPRPYEAGQPTISLLCEDLVRAAVRAYMRQWVGGGRPVTSAEVAEVARATDRGAQALHIIQARGQSLAGALGNAARIDLPDGRDRKDLRLLRIEGPDGHTYYDLPEGRHQLRALHLKYRDLRRRSSARAVHSLVDEARAVRPLLASGSRPIKALGSARHLLNLRTWRMTKQGLEDLWDRRSELRKPAQKAIQEGLRRLTDAEMQLSHAASEAEARSLVEGAGHDMGVVHDTPRPLLTAHECAAWLTERQLGRKTPPEYMARTRLPSFPNPRFEQKGVEDPEARVQVAYDRVGALDYLVRSLRSRMISFVSNGAGLLGPDLRAPDLVVPLLDGSRSERRLGLAALCLLGDDRAGQRALEILDRSDVEYEDAQAAIWTLMLGRQLTLDDLPDHLRRPGRPRLTQMLREALRAAGMGRWLY